jgi:nucleoid-associated protein YgaU
MPITPVNPPVVEPADQIPSAEEVNRPPKTELRVGPGGQKQSPNTFGTERAEAGSGDGSAQTGDMEQINKVAKGLGESLVPVQREREYIAQPNDNLSRLAAMLPGGNTRANRAAILKANPTLQANPNFILVGRKYILPAVSPGSVAPGPGPGLRSTPAGSDWTYIVKPGDTLWKIAAEQLGSGTASAGIKELNKDILRGSDTLHPNMKLHLPPKPLAAAN